MRRAFVKPDIPSGLLPKEGYGYPRFPGNPLAHLPCSKTPDGFRCQTFSAPHCCPRNSNNEGSTDIQDFVAQSHGFCAHCLRFMPPLLTTMQNSFPTGGQPLPGGILSHTHRVSLKSFYS